MILPNAFRARYRSCCLELGVQPPEDFRGGDFLEFDRHDQTQGNHPSAARSTRYLAQMERELIAERTKAGLDEARKRGRIVGRRRQMTPSKIESARQLLNSGMPPREVARNLGVSVPTLYRWVPASNR